MTGLLSVEFRCPQCKSLKWGTRDDVGVCSGCGFRWARRCDFRVFFRKNGAGFSSREELDAVLRGVDYGRPPTVEELLHELLSFIMHKPPTLGVVQLWTRKEQRAALHWLTHEVLGDTRPRAPRPPFIEEGAATA